MTFASKDEALAFADKLGLTGIAIVPTTHAHWTFTSMSALTKPATQCSICGEWFVENSCNAMPVNPGRCCAYCDDHVVTPARIAMAT